MLWKIGEKIAKILKIDRTTSVSMRGNFARLCVEVDLTKPLLAKFKLRRRIQRIMYEGLHLVCFHCAQYGHKQDLCPHACHAGQTETRDENLPSEPSVPVIRPEIMDSFGTWMIVEQKQRRPSRRMVVEETVAAGKGGGQAGFSGAASKAVTDGYINVSTRYDVLMGINGGNGSREAGDKNAGEKRG